MSPLESSASSERVERLRQLWREHAEPWLGVVFLAAGFLWDALTLVRIDRLADDLLLLGYLVALAALLILERRVEDAPERWPWLAPHHGWLVYGSQFFLGGLFSAELVFYARSASFGPQLLFVVALAALLVANEFQHHHFRRSWLRLGLFWLVSFAFFLFFVPVVTGFPGPGLQSVAAVLATIAGLAVVAAMSPMPTPEERRRILAPHAGFFLVLGVAMVLAESAGLVPPVPLAAMEIGVFHGVEPRRDPDPTRQRRSTRYWLRYERPPWYLPFRDQDSVFRWRDGEKAHCFSAIFAPSGMELKLFHAWDRWDDEAGWETRDRIDVTRTVTLRGGADMGFRTFSAKSRLEEGTWRCRVVTADDREIGRTRFTIVKADGVTDLVERPYD